MGNEIEVFRETLKPMKKRFEALLGNALDDTRFTMALMVSAQTNPKLLECNRDSLLIAATQAAQDQLLPDGKEGALIPYGGIVKWRPMIAGIVKRIKRQNNNLKEINAIVVRQKDSYEHWLDENGEHFKHVFASGDRGEVVLTYAFARFNDGSFFFEEIIEADMDVIKSKSTAKDGVWKDFPDEMRRKSAIKRLSKYRLPIDDRSQDILRRDDEDFDFDQPKIKKTEEGTSSRLRALVEENKETPSEIANIVSEEFTKENKSQKDL